MTLVEIVVSMVILMIILSTLSGIYLVSMNYMQEYSSKRTGKMITDNLMDLFLDNITYSTEICIVESSSDDGKTTIPDGWEEANTNWLSFAPESEDGRLGYTTTPDIYGDEYYKEGTIRANVSYDNKADDAQGTKNLNIHMDYIDYSGEVKYTRDRTIDVINLSWFNKDITGVETTDNSSKYIYIYYKHEPQVVSEDKTYSDVYALWLSFKDIYDKNTADNPEYYSKSNIKTQVYNEDGTNIGTAYNRWSLIGWQYRGSKLNPNYWTSGTDPKRVQEFMILDNEKIANAGLSDAFSSSKTWYLLPYHYYSNTNQCDMLFYVKDGYTFDNLARNKAFSSNLIYNNEEDKWYYFKKGVTSGTRGTCKTLMYNNASVDAPVVYGDKADGTATNLMTYTDNVDGEIHTATITSSFQIKRFFKQYGEEVIFN